MSLHNYNLKNGPPAKIDVRKLPPGHATFSGNNHDKGLYVCWGHPYDHAGNKLPADVSWLKENGYYTGTDLTKQLISQQSQYPTAAPKKYCFQCNAEITASAKFCGECGTPQTKSVVWTPGSGDEEGAAIARLIDQDDPLGSIPQDEPVRQTAEEIFAELTKGEAAKTLREAGSRGLDGADLSLTKLETNAYGTIEMPAPARKEKAKK